MSAPTTRDLEDLVIAGNNTKLFLENPDVLRAFAKIEDRLYVRFRKAKPGDSDELKEIQLIQYGLDLLRTELQKPIREGIMAQKRITERRSQRETE